MYRNVKFRVRPLDQLLPLIAEAKERTPNLRRVFLGDGNALAAPTNELLPILQRLKSAFPTLSTISCAARASDLLEKTPADLALLRSKGLSLIYLGVESGDDEVLRRIKAKQPKVPVLLLTGHASVESAMTGVETGAVDYVLKPVPLNDLIARLRDLTSSTN